MAKKRPDIQARLTRRPPPPTDQPAIDRLMTSARGDVQASDLDLKAVRLDRIVPDPDQPRRSIPSETLEDLAASIREQGVIQPIEVDYDPDQDVYVLVHGERRWRAAQMAGLETIPAIIKPSRLDRATRLVRQLIENIQREDLNDVDRAQALVALRNQMQAELEARLEAEGAPDATAGTGKATWKTRVTWAQVGQRVGLSRARMSQLRALLDLPDEIREDVRRGRITERDSRVYRGLPPDQQKALHHARQEQGLTATQAREAAALLKIEAQTPEPKTVEEVIALITTPPPPEPIPEQPPTPTAAPPDETAPPATTAPPLQPVLEPQAGWAGQLTQIRNTLHDLQDQEIAPGTPTEILLALIKEIQTTLTRLQERIANTAQQR